MQAVILAAGKGTRMQPLTETIPKPMLPLRGKPKLEYTLRWLPAEIDHVIFTINHLGEQIRDYFGDNFSGKKISYVFQEELNGTGGAVHCCRDILDDDFLVMMGDDLYHPADIRQMVDEKLALMACSVDDPSSVGILVSDAAGVLKKIIEPPHESQTNLVNTGLYKLTRHFFDYPLVPVYGGKEFGLPQTLLSMSPDHPVVVKEATLWKPLGRVADISEAEEALDKFFQLNKI